MRIQGNENEGVSIYLETEEEVKTFWHRYNVNEGHTSSYYNSYSEHNMGTLRAIAVEIFKRVNKIYHPIDRWR